MRVRKTVLSGVFAIVLLVSLAFWQAPASAYSLTWSGRPGNMSFSDPVARLGVYGSAEDSVQLDVNTVSASSGAGQQYAQIHLHVYYSCTAGWCNAGSQNWYTGWFYTQWDLSGSVLSIPVPVGRYYTYVAQTTWYNANGTAVGRETYYPTAPGVQPWYNTQPYYGSHDFACVGYAHDHHACTQYGLAGASFSPTGKVYVLYAG
jgi:hypothetical protein